MHEVLEPATTWNDDAYDANGVDRSLVRWMLSLTPTERLEYVQGTIDVQRHARRVRDGDR